MSIILNRRFRIAAFLCITLLAALYGTGCGTLKEIKQAIEETNRAMLPSNVLPDAEGSRTAEAWEEPSARIDEYITRNSADKVAASALRVRQAMLLLSYHKYELARAAFNQATDLKLQRDIVLKNLCESLIWWFSLDKQKAPDYTLASEHIKAFTIEINKLGGAMENQQIKQYLEEMRAWIEIYMAEKSATKQFMAKYIGEAMDHYAETLSDKDIDAINEGKPTPGVTPLSTDVRRQLRAMYVIERAKKVVEEIKNLDYTVNYQSLKANRITAIK